VPNTKERAEDTCPPIYQCRLPLSTNTVNHLADLLRAHLKAIRSRWRILTPGKIAVIVLAVLRHDQRLAHLRTAGLGALADLGFRGLDNDLLDPVIVTGYTVTRTHKLTPGQKTANRVLAVGRAPAEHGFAHLKNWRTLTKLRIDPARATRLLRALLDLGALAEARLLNGHTFTDAEWCVRC
jgi:hypothetical protein